MPKSAKPRKARSFRQITAALPELEGNTTVEMAADELDQANALANMAESEGGKALIASLYADASALVQNIITFSRLGDTEHILTSAMRLDVIMKILSELKGASNNAIEMQKLVDELIQQST